jgi:hypothetical protein
MTLREAEKAVAELAVELDPHKSYNYITYCVRIIEDPNDYFVMITKIL